MSTEQTTDHSFPRMIFSYFFMFLFFHKCNFLFPISQKMFDQIWRKNTPDNFLQPIQSMFATLWFCTSSYLFFLYIIDFFFFTNSLLYNSSYPFFILYTLYLVKFLYGMFEDPEAKRWQEKAAKLFSFHTFWKVKRKRRKTFSLKRMSNFSSPEDNSLWWGKDNGD